MAEEKVSAIYRLLAANGYIYPAVLTKKQFDEYAGELKNPSDPESVPVFYGEFALKERG